MSVLYRESTFLKQRIVVILEAGVLLLATAAACLGGYLTYDADAALQRQRQNMYPTDGSAVHPSQRPKKSRAISHENLACLSNIST